PRIWRSVREASNPRPPRLVTHGPVSSFGILLVADFLRKIVQFAGHFLLCREILDDLELHSIRNYSFLNEISLLIPPPIDPVVGQLICEKDEGTGLQLRVKQRQEGSDSGLGNVRPPTVRERRREGSRNSIQRIRIGHLAAHVTGGKEPSPGQRNHRGVYVDCKHRTRCRRDHFSPVASTTGYFEHIVALEHVPKSRLEWRAKCLRMGIYIPCRKIVSPAPRGVVLRDFITEGHGLQPPKLDRT